MVLAKGWLGVLALRVIKVSRLSIPCLVQVAVHVEDVDEFRRVTDDRVKDRHYSCHIT